jgi:hypothetical protein
MNAASHLSDEQIARYRGRTLAPADLLDADDHLVGCDTCRDRLARTLDTLRAGSRLRASLATHLGYEAVVACAEGRGTPEDRQHLAECDLCAGEVADLRAFQGELREQPRAVVEMPARKPWQARISRKWLAAAAVVALAAELGFWSWLNHRARPAAVASIPAVELHASVAPFERAAVLDRLISQPGALLGAGTSAAQFELIAPMATAVTVDRPVFRWKPLGPRATYVVAVFDESFQKVAESPAIAGTEWQPERALPRGVVLNWQVTAHAGGKTVHAPMPPAPEARIEVAPEADAAAIGAARRANPADHLRIASLYVKAGALDEAEAELNQVDASTAAPFREQLRKMRTEPRP